MTNKEKLKNAIDKDINKTKNYNLVINNMDKGSNNKKHLWKLCFVPICLSILIIGIMFINQNRLTNELSQNFNTDEEQNLKLNINILNNDEIISLDTNVDIILDNNINIPYPFKYDGGEIIIPHDLDKSNTYIVYTNANKDSYDSLSYNVLYNYILCYTNDNGRNIKVAYSKDNIPIRDYFFKDNGLKTTTINGIELKIYQFENNYFTNFNYNNYNFDIETSNITEKELSDFLLSIIK